MENSKTSPERETGKRQEPANWYVGRSLPIGTVTFTDIYVGDLKLTDENIDDNARLVKTLADSITFQ